MNSRKSIRTNETESGLARRRFFQLGAAGLAAIGGSTVAAPAEARSADGLSAASPAAHISQAPG
ncbi:hypothetical protein GCM10022402_39440 [Salinactinospora qingdaonensis]|uniref:Uncharacterized protein n=1 Tax=Salinactinospora qingdaonensis TaxID=702744 RepID=A0ABP7G6T3_9ACTN